ncbi:MAG TPA: CBASS oligonucleotide cyclase [Pyrinomonadaceae bacterium]|nr:CBASS oligonucleotide cyclase [Pyrinomonadaceae bacterium]
MSGGGGHSFSGKIDAAQLFRKLRSSESETSVQEFEVQVADMLGSLLSQYNKRDTEKIDGYLSKIREVISDDIEGTVDLLFGGSVSKHTYIDGLSDIDALVLLNKSELKDKSPQEVKRYFFEKLKEDLPHNKIKEGNLAVTVDFGDAEIQLLPAIRTKSGVKIADAEGTEWSHIRPRKFSEVLTKVNRDQGGKVVPSIKLAKAIISDLPEHRQLTGYHIESLAVEVFKQYTGPKKPQEMLTYFFRQAPKYVLEPLSDRTGQSLHVDEYLGEKYSLKRKVVADSLGRVGRRLQSANEAMLAEEWKNILGEE